jgi:large subunit ribosomal protein L4
VKVRNLKNEEVGDLELSDAVFGAEYNEGLVHAAVKSFLANARQGTVGTKTRGDVSGSGKKLWKQKGTGRARIASIRSPLWKGGGNVHGPQARDWSQPLPKKMRRGALRAALSERLREGNLIIVDEIVFSGPKTKDFIGALQALGFGGRTLIVDTLDNDNLMLSSRNVKGAKVVASGGLNVYDVLYHEKLLVSRSAVEQITRALDPQGGGVGATEEAA